MTKPRMIYELVYAKHRRTENSASYCDEKALEAVYNEGIIAGVRRAQSTANALPTESHGVMRRTFIERYEIQSMFLKILKELRG